MHEWMGKREEKLFVGENGNCLTESDCDWHLYAFQISSRMCNLMLDESTWWLFSLTIFFGFLSCHSHTCIARRRVQLDDSLHNIITRIPVPLQDATTRLVNKQPVPRPTAQLLQLIKYFRWVDIPHSRSSSHSSAVRSMEGKMLHTTRMVAWQRAGKWETMKCSRTTECELKNLVGT